MASTRAAGESAGATAGATAAIDAGRMIAAIVAFLMLLPGAWLNARAAGALSDADQACLGCHGSEGLKKKLASKETLSLHVQGKAFANSVHAAIGCAGCHAEVDLAKHPSDRKIESAREYSVAQAGVCKTCHEDKFKLYEGSIHAVLVRDGNAGAPVCTDCHSPHEVSPKAVYETMASVPCKQCHVAIFEAYAGSMHGKARSASNKSGAPLCSDCHRAHEVKAVAAGDIPRTACLVCHANALDAHRKWLPNAGLHFEVVSCPVCHAPTAQRRVDLMLIDSGTQKRVTEQHGIPQFESRARAADTQGKGLDAMALWNLLKTFNTEGMDGRTTLRGRLEVRTGAEAHQLADKTKAISDCNVCHREGSAAFQSVTVSVAGPDGRPVRYGASKEVLSSVISVDSVSGFYAIGATRIKILDILLLLALFSGIAVPAGHLAMKYAFRLYLKRVEAEKASASAQADAQPSSGDRPTGGAAK